MIAFLPLPLSVGWVYVKMMFVGYFRTILKQSLKMFFYNDIRTFLQEKKAMGVKRLCSIINSFCNTSEKDSSWFFLPQCVVLDHQPCPFALPELQYDVATEKQETKVIK